MRPVQPNKHYIFNYAFVSALLILILNDHVLKQQFPGFITGKLSDIAGMVILPLLLSFFIPRLKTHSIWISIAFFILWKSSYSSPFVYLYNQFAPISITRTIDYSDLWAFLVLPLPYIIIKSEASPGYLQINRLSLHPAFIIVPCMLTLMATSPPAKYYYTASTGNIDLTNLHFKTQLSSSQFFLKMKSMGIEAEIDTTLQPAKYVPSRLSSSYPYYKIKRLVIDTDTITDLQLALFEKNKKTTVYINAITVEKNLSDKKLNKKLAKYYKELIGNYFKSNFGY